MGLTSEKRITASLRRSLATVRRTIVRVTRVITASRAQARDQPMGSAAAQRVEAGQQELIALEGEQGMLESEIARREP